MTRINIIPFLTLLFLFLPRQGHAAEVFFEDSINYRKLDAIMSKELSGGSPLNIKPGDMFVVFPKQGIPVMLIQPLSSDSKIQINSAQINEALAEQYQPILNSSVNELVDGLRKADSLIAKRDYQQAQMVIQTLKTKYPTNSSVLFMNASLSYLQKDKLTALSDLRKGLQINPDNESAKALLKQLEVSQ